ncbi:MAG: asparagine synthase (glutamine-hydrolyzing) [Gammaproteobacteria bacterium]
MCGIAGFIGRGDKQVLSNMLRSIVHRGPDDAGTYHLPSLGIFLGHRRLSIVDIDGGHQPMSNENGQIQVVFNGEIYNHRELRLKLIDKGYRFSTDHSDTEVLVHGYKEWGEKLPMYLNGMFAFAIFDKTNKRMFLARDRFGEKPLFYSKNAQQFVFASELKAVLTHPDVSRKISKLSMKKFFALGFVPAPDSIIDSVNKLMPGHQISLDVSSSEMKVTPYWQFKITPTSEIKKTPISELSEQLRELVFQAVERRLMSDVPLGIFLSGGLDSTIMLAAMAKVVPAKEINTFSIGFKERSFDESQYAKLVADHYGTQHHTEQLDIDAGQKLLAPVLRKLDEPLGDPSIIPTYLLTKFAREHVKVAIGGDGGDELFAGYDPFRALLPAKVYSSIVPDCMHRTTRSLLERLKSSDRNMSFEFRLKRTLRGLSYPKELWNPVWLGPLDPKGLEGLFGEEISVSNVYRDVLDSWSNSSKNSTLVDKTSEFYTRLYLSNDILTKVDRASMMVSLEARAPFLDNDLVDFVKRLPSEYKLKGKSTKFLLKHAFKDIVPDVVLKRPKKGFGIPLNAWLKEWKDTSFLDSLPHIDHDWLKARREEHLKGLADHRQLLWCAISVDEFLKSIPNA